MAGKRIFMRVDFNVPQETVDNDQRVKVGLDSA